MKRSEFQFVGAEELTGADWPRDPRALSARRYLTPLIRDGAAAYVLNADVRVGALLGGGQVIPVTISPGGQEHQTNVVSVRSHYVDYPRQELHRLRHPALAPPVNGALLLLGHWMKRACLDRVVCLNNWLWQTNPPFDLTTEQLVSVTRLLVERFPGHALLIRSLNRVVSGPLCRDLPAAGYRLLRSRRIFILDPMNPKVHRSRDRANDLRLERRDPLPVRKASALNAEQSRRVEELYRGLYLDRYSSLNCQYTSDYFSLLAESGAAEVRLIDAGGRIGCMTAWSVREEVMTGIMIGHDLAVPQSRGLLRRAFSAMIDEAIASGRLFNMSSGSGPFKMNRGAVPVTEYDAVFTRNLPLRQRRGWSVLSILLRIWERAESRLMPEPPS